MMKKNLVTFVFVSALLTLITFKANAQEGVVSISQDSDIDKLLEFKKDIKTVDLFKIQIYSGKRSGAENTQNQFKSLYINWPVSMEYETPNYKIWVGNFRTRLEADRALMEVKKSFVNAFIFAPKKEHKVP